MSDEHSGIESLIISVFTFITTAGTIIFLFYIGISLAYANYQANLNLGIRSISGLLLPWIIMTFISRHGHLKPVFLSEKPNIVALLLAFGIFIIVGYVMMFSIRWFSEYLSPGIPLREIVVSGVLSLLLFSSVHAYYYGMFTGILLYVVLNGMPMDIVSKGIINMM